MRRDLGAAVLVGLTSLAACVEVPDTIRTHFAPASPDERSNFRPGPHGTAPPNEEPAPAAAKESPLLDAGADPDASPPVPVPVPVPEMDGGVS